MKQILLLLIFICTITIMNGQIYCEDYGRRTHASFVPYPDAVWIGGQTWEGDGDSRIQKLKFDIGNEFEDFELDFDTIYLEENNYELNFVSYNKLCADRIKWDKVEFTSNGVTSVFIPLTGTAVHSYDLPSNIFPLNGEGSGEFRFYNNGWIKRKCQVYYKIIPKSDDYYEDDFGNTMSVWRSGKPNATAIVVSEGVDFHDVRPAQYYWRIDGKHMFQCLLDAGFDVYVLDYDRGQADLKTNARSYQYAVRKVAEDVGKDVIAAGFSMGGVITRYACANQEGMGNPLPITHMVCIDAPHQGAVVNGDAQRFFLRLEQFLSAFATLPISECKRNDAMRKIEFQFIMLKTATAQQLLNFNLFDPATLAGTVTENTTFYGLLGGLNGGTGYPQLPKTIAISFGNPQTPNPNPTGNIINMDYEVGGMVEDIAQQFSDALTADGITSTYSDGSGTVDIFNDPLSSQAGSYFPKIKFPVLQADILNILDIFSITIADPPAAYFTFMPINSTLDLASPLDITTSAFDEVIHADGINFHDNIPAEIRTKLLIQMLKDDLYLQNQTIEGARDYYATQTIEAGYSVDGTQPFGNFVLGATADVRMQAGESIFLDAGFISLPGAYLITEIGGTVGCGDQLYQGKQTAPGDIEMEATTDRSQEEETEKITARKEGEMALLVYPNPVQSGEINIQFELKSSESVEVRLYSLSGQLLEVIAAKQKMPEGQNSIQWSSNNLDKGMYLVEVSSNKERSLSKLIKL